MRSLLTRVSISLRAYVWIACGLVAFAACSLKTDGPTPEITSIVPQPICDAQQAITITITGSGFSPAVVDGLVDNPTLVLPRVAFIDASATIEVPPDNVSVPDASGTELVVTIAQGLLTPGAYSVEVTNANGNSTTFSGFIVTPPPDLISIDPASSAPGKVVTLTLTGTGFQPGMTVTLDATPPVMCTSVTASADGTSAACTLDLTAVTPGTYAIVVDNGDGCSDTLPLAFTVGNEFTLSGIEPPFGWTGTDTNVTIFSTGGFSSTPRVEMRPAGQVTPVIVMKRVAFVDSSTLTAVVPMGLALGLYDITVINPPSNPGFATLTNAFRVVSMPVPTVEEVVPSRGDPASNVPVTIYGSNFRSPVRVELLNRTGTVVAMTATNTVVSSTEITTTIPTPATEDAYLVRVTNLDENTYGTWSAFIVGSTGASGNLHAFTTSSPLITGRRMHAGVSARDDLGNTFLYAIGGDTGATGNALDSVEVAQLSNFGALSPWRAIRAPNRLTTTRRGAAAVTVPLFGSDPFIPIKTYVYVTGGQDMAGTVLGTVERAMVLRNADAPDITSIAASATAGTLAAGTWYYKVSAILDAADPDNPGGETLPSDEEILTISSTQSAIDLAWSAVTVNSLPAAGYRIYRTAMVDGVSQQERLIATVTGTTYTDTGATAGAESPLPAGSLGVWRLQTPAHGIRWGHQAAVITDVTNNNARYLHVLGGKSDNAAGYLGTIEVAPINATTGAIGSFVTTGAVAMTTPRAFFSLLVETPQNVVGFTGIARMFTIGGVKAGMTVNSSTASSDFEQADVAAGGANGGWTQANGITGLGVTRAGPLSVLTSNKMFVMGGAGMATNTAFSVIRSNGSDIGFGSSGATGTLQATGTPLPAPRALGTAIIGAGFIYFVGGTSDGSDATNTTFQTF